MPIDFRTQQPTRVRRSLSAALSLFVGGTCLILAGYWPVFAADATALTRLTNDIKYLASDDLEGRGVGSKGLDLAADFVRDEFAKAGLDVTRVNGGAFQPFPMTIGAALGSPNTLTFNGAPDRKVELQLSKEFTPLSFGGSGKLAGEFVFVGYGVTAPDQKYDDYADIDVKGKTVIVLRRTPRQGRPDSPFTGHTGMAHESLQTKASNANSHGAVAMLIVTDEYSLKKEVAEAEKYAAKLAENAMTAAEEFLKIPVAEADKVEAGRKKLQEEVATYKAAKGHVAKGPNDSLLPFSYGGSDSVRSIPILHITREALDKVLKPSIDKTLSQLEAAIDKDLKPQSALIPNWTLAGDVTIDRKKADVKNIIGVLEGTGPLADETVIIGAHYDHVGRGGAGSLAPGSNEIHNGADDNASGTVALIEVARRLAARKEKLPRRVVFIAFTAEERGLIGSAHYVKNPVFPLEKTVAMLNMDMVGRMLDNKLTVFGVGTAPTWKELVEKTGKANGLNIIEKPEGLGPSDHSSFYARKIPVLHFFSGTHSDYHRPGDDWEKINFEGMGRIVDMVEQVTTDTALAPERPKYVEVKGSAQIDRAGSRPYFGSIPDFGSEKPGYALGGVAGGSPAEKGGLKAGDNIIQIGTYKIENLEDFDAALRKFGAGDIVDVTVTRGSDKVTVKVTLDKPK